jgi:zinc and cadmium transporter
MQEILWLVPFTLLGGAMATVIASVFLLLPVGLQTRALPLLVACAMGALLGTAFLELLPHAFENADHHRAESLGLLMFFGVLPAFVLDKSLRTKAARLSADKSPAVPLALASDSLHKLVDGIVIAAATVTDPTLGLVTALAILAHEVPNDLGIIAILRDSGMGRLTTFLLKLAVSLTMILGGLIGLIWMSLATDLRPYILAFGAVLFIYTALAALLPRLHQSLGQRATGTQLLCITLGGLVIWGMHLLTH